MTTYTWVINQLLTLQQPEPDYVVQADWRLVGDDGGTFASYPGSSQFSSDQSSPFIPYDQLTEEIVVGWIQAQLGAEQIAAIEANIQDQINVILNPPVTPQPTPLPWATPAPAVVSAPPAA